MKDTQRRSINWQASAREDLEGPRKWRLEPTRQKPLSPAMKRTVGKDATTRIHSHCLMGVRPVLLSYLEISGVPGPIPWSVQRYKLIDQEDGSVIVQLWARRGQRLSFSVRPAKYCLAGLD